MSESTAPVEAAFAPGMGRHLRQAALFVAPLALLFLAWPLLVALFQVDAARLSGRQGRGHGRARKPARRLAFRACGGEPRTRCGRHRAGGARCRAARRRDGRQRGVSAFLTPLFRFFSVLAGIAWIPIATLWFGYGFGAITFVIFNAVFFIVAYNTLLGVTAIPMRLRHAAASLGAGPVAMVTEVLLPGALPNIVTGIRTGLGFAWRGLIAAEMIATNVGLGYMLFVARDFYRTEVIVLGMIVIGVLWLLIDRLILAPLERATIERWGLVQRA